jgi:hypothetical protein
MMDYLVVGVYASDLERFATTVSAENPEDAETKAKAEASSELIVAAVIERSTLKIVA